MTSKIMTDKQIETIARAHTDLNIFAAIQNILEGGCIYTRTGSAAAQKIINLCRGERQRQVRIYDAGMCKP